MRKAGTISEDGWDGNCERESAPPNTVIKKGLFPWLTEKGRKKIFLVKFQMAGSWLERD